jgi:hypothetical protein
MKRYLKAAVAVAIAAILALIGLTATSSAAVTGESAASNTVQIPVTRLVNTPGHSLSETNPTAVIKVAGVDGIPANATGIAGRLVAYQAAGGESLVIWDGVKGSPGDATVTTGPTTPARSGPSNSYTTALRNGAVSVHLLTGAGSFLLEVTSYTLPTDPPAAPLAGSYYSVAKYDVGDTNGGAVATVACKLPTDTAISGGVRTLAAGTNGLTNNVPVSSSFPGRMDWATNTPIEGRSDGWIFQFGTETGAAPKFVTLYALCVPGLTIPFDTTFTESSSN